MLRINRFAAAFAVTLGLGALVVGHTVLLPGLDAQTQLVDANLAKSLSLPVMARLDDLVLGCTVVACLTARRATGLKLATTFALVALIGVLFHRFWVLPQLVEAWSRVDLTIGQPVDRLVAAESLARVELSVTSVLALMFVGLGWSLTSPRSRDDTSPAGEPEAGSSKRVSTVAG